MEKRIKIILIAVSVIVFLVFAFLVGKVIYDNNKLKEEDISIAAATPVPTATPIPNEPLMVIDASNMNTADTIEIIVNDIGTLYGTENIYIKKDYSDIDDILEAIADYENAVIIAPQDILGKMNIEYTDFDTSQYNYTQMAVSNPTSNYVPFAFSIYGYLFRYDIAQSLELMIPQDYGDIMEFARTISTDSYLYGFSVAGNDTTSAMYAKQITDKYGDGNVYAATILDFMWQNQCIPPDSGMVDDMGCAVAYTNDAVASTYVDGYGLNYIYQNNIDIFDRTFKLNYLGQEASFPVRPISIGVVSGTDTETVTDFIDKLYAQSEVLFKENPGFLPAVADVTLDTPYSSIMTQADGFIYYNDEYQGDFLESIVYYSLPVEETVARK